MFFGLIDLHVENHLTHVMCRVIDLDFQIIENAQYPYPTLSKEELIIIIRQLKEKHQLQHMSISIPSNNDGGILETVD